MTVLSRSDVERIVREAREAGARPDLAGADLRGADLREADLYRADLREASLYRADLAGADLRGADLYRADLREADLREADLRGADLHGADLRGADLHGANLHGANLHKAVGALSLGDTPSGPANLRPLPSGRWLLTVGCWSGTTADLRALAAGDDYPSGCDASERARRRPILMSLAAYADVLAAYHRDWLTAVVDTWGTTTDRKDRR